MKSGAARAPDLTLVSTNGTLIRQPTPVGASAPILLFPESTEATPQSPSALRAFLDEERVRWLSSLAAVLIVYAGILGGFIYAASIREAIPPPAGAMVVEMMLEASAPPSGPEAPPSPEPVEPTPPPPEPEPLPEPEPEIPPAPEAPKPAVVTPPKREKPVEPKPQPEVQPREKPDTTDEKPAEPTSAVAPPNAAPDNQQTGTPNMGTPNASTANQTSPWRDLLLYRLEQAKRYPYQARRMRQEGVSYLRFTMDREGQVLSASIDQSSGHKLLDDEVLALIRRVQPLPKPPSDIPGDPVEVVVPVEFFLRR